MSTRLRGGARNSPGDLTVQVALPSSRNVSEPSDEAQAGAVEQVDAADEAGASVGASPLIHVLCGPNEIPRGK